MNRIDFLKKAFNKKFTDEELKNEAYSLKQKLLGKYITFIRNRNINYTNFCVNDCNFCAFSKKELKESFTLTIEQIVAKTLEYSDITEVCIQGGLNPNLKYSYYLDMLSQIKQTKPEIHIHAFSPQEVYFISQENNLKIEKVLEEFKKRGLGSLPGTAAEILVDKVRKQICPHKINSAKWREIIETAHKMGIKTTATIMFGHVETKEDIISHLELIKGIQEKTNGFSEFVPLPFMPFKTDLGKSKNINKMVSLEDIFRLLAISRIYFGSSLKHIQASWVKIGLDNTIKSFEYGVDDIGGTLYEENITKSAGGKEGELLDLAYLKERGIPLKPRTTLYGD